MLCPNCQRGNAEEDLYCRHCGTDLAIPITSVMTLPIANSSLFYKPPLSRLAASVGALAIGVGLELLRRSLLMRLSRSSQSVVNAPAFLGGEVRDRIMATKTKNGAFKLPKGYEIHETITSVHRVIRPKE